MAHYRNQNAGDGSWSDFFGDVYSGIAVGIGHPKWFVEKTIGQGLSAISSLSAAVGIGEGSVDGGGRGVGEGIDTGINDTGDSSQMSNESEAPGLKVVGVGYGRTGTYSLALALDELGFPTLVSAYNFYVCI